MKEEKVIQQNLDWFKSGKVGCTFASFFARIPESIGWKFVVDPEDMIVPPDCLLLSLVFPDLNQYYVRQWALQSGFYLENIDEGLTGLRYKFPDGVSWAQYFGFDADVKTRQCPHPMLTMSVKLPPVYYAKVGFKGILHIAHASVKGISGYVANRLWDTSHENTARQLGYKPTIKEAAKTTFHEQDFSDRASASRS